MDRPRLLAIDADLLIPVVQDCFSSLKQCGDGYLNRISLLSTSASLVAISVDRYLLTNSSALALIFSRRTSLFRSIAMALPKAARSAIMTCSRWRTLSPLTPTLVETIGNPAAM